MIQHYVPKVYLRNFAEQKAKGSKVEYYVDVFDKLENSFIKPNIKNICAERHFYTLGDETNTAKDKMAIERVYSEFIEPMYQSAYDILTNDEVIYITEEQRAEILIGIMQLYTRNPAILTQMLENSRMKIENMIIENRAKGIKGVTYLEEDYSFRDYTDEMIFVSVELLTTNSFKELHLKGTQEMLEFHAEAKFQVEKLNDNSQFFTSDNPLVMSDSLSDNQHPFLRSKNFRIALNKEYSLLIQHDNRKELNRIYKCFAGGGNAWSANKDVFENSSRFVITTKDSMEAYEKMNSFMNDNDPEKMIPVLRQIVTKFDGDEESEKTRKLMMEFLDSYDKGEISTDDFQKMFQETKFLGNEMINNRIKKEL